MINTFFKKNKFINCNGKLIDLSMPVVMGILNITPDSFYVQSRVSEKDVVNQVGEMLKNGAGIIDIGAYSSRPGAEHVDLNTEWNRLLPVLKSIRKNFSDIIISVDTFRSEIAHRAVKDYSVDIINDISAGEMDSAMFETIAKLNVPYIIMHMLGTPQTMQKNPHYKDLLSDIFLFFAKKIDKLNLLGVSDIIIDPGFGFGKTLEHNYELMAKSSEFRIFELPLLVGVSRKSMIYKYLDITPEDALNGTTVLNTIALNNGADIIRVHDVKQAVETVKLFTKVKSYMY
jgi:dihydropteroate synthase